MVSNDAPWRAACQQTVAHHGCRASAHRVPAHTSRDPVTVEVAGHGGSVETELDGKLADCCAGPIGLDDVDDHGGGEASLGRVRKPSPKVHHGHMFDNLSRGWCWFEVLPLLGSSEAVERTTADGCVAAVLTDGNPSCGTTCVYDGSLRSLRDSPERGASDLSRRMAGPTS